MCSRVIDLRRITNCESIYLAFHLTCATITSRITNYLNALPCVTASKELSVQGCCYCSVLKRFSLMQHGQIERECFSDVWSLHQTNYYVMLSFEKEKNVTEETHSVKQTRASVVVKYHFLKRAIALFTSQEELS